MEDKSDTNVEETNKLTVMIDSKFLNCHICHCPLELPVFQCTKIHFVCGRCSTDTAGKCTCSCNLTSCPSLDAIVQSATVCCPNSQFGCQEMYLYCDKSAHERYCSFDPNFFCHIGYCTFQSATPEDLTSHFKSKHSMMCRNIQYSEEFGCMFFTNDVNYKLVTDKDGRSFLVVYESNGDGFYVSLLCIGSEWTAEDLCYEITAYVGFDRDVVWSITSSHIICIRRWTGIIDKCRSLFLPSEACPRFKEEDDEDEEEYDEDEEDEKEDDEDEEEEYEFRIEVIVSIRKK